MNPVRNLYIFYSLAILAVLLAWQGSPPDSFPTSSIITVPQGVSLSSLAQNLEDTGVIRSSLIFRLVAAILRSEHNMKAGEYKLGEPQNAITLAWRISRGEHGIETAKITIPEGFSKIEISNLFDERFQFLDHSLFLASAREGYLFPDTYFIPVTAREDAVRKLLEENFIRKTQGLETSKEIIIMASLIEGEAKTEKDRETVSDILWKRLKKGMPLQVDVDMSTYEFKGLPPEPINNPGIISIRAAIYPASTPYLYYLTGDDGKMYYSRTHDEHVLKKAKYIKR